jgi:two-component system OmpR family sensor kinase/two-component system sensor histidine kinase QseC
VTLRVDDAGPGIPEAERQRVFDRFYRRAEGGESGSGLGLAIVAQRRRGARRDGRRSTLAAGRAARRSSASRGARARRRLNARLIEP